MAMSRGEVESAVGRELTTDERLLWSGQPRQGLLLRPSDAVMIPFSLLWGGFAIFWEVSVQSTGAPGFFALWGLPFVLVGLYLIFGRFITDARARANTVYALSDRRALVIFGGSRKAARSVDLRVVGEIGIVERADGTGTITFGTGAGRAGRGSPALDLIADARSVYQQACAAQAAALAAAG